MSVLISKSDSSSDADGSRLAAAEGVALRRWFGRQRGADTPGNLLLSGVIGVPDPQARADECLIRACEEVCELIVINGHAGERRTRARRALRWRFMEYEVVHLSVIVEDEREKRARRCDLRQLGRLGPFTALCVAI
jgi:hypothetical protein